MSHLNRLDDIEMIVPEEEAVETILQAIKYGEKAYGKTSEELIEWLLDSILKTDDSLIEALFLCRELSCVEEICKELAESFYMDNPEFY